MAREGIPIISGITLVAILLWVVTFATGLKTMAVPAGIAVLGFLFSVYFFRDPERTVAAKAAAVVSPADGKIIDIQETEEPDFIKGKALKISVFLSVFDVHVNRIPLAGVIRFKEHRKGRFLVASNENASSQNEHVSLGIECQNQLKITVKQVAGLIARRIICRAESGESYATGQRYGLIRFGSRTDLYLPISTHLNIKKGDRVKGGLTVIGEIQS